LTTPRREATIVTMPGNRWESIAAWLARRRSAPAAGPSAPRPATLGSAPPAFGGSATPRRSLLRRAARAGLVALGALVVALIALVAVVSYKAAAVVHARAVVRADEIGARIGRAVTVGPAHVTLGSEITIQLDDLRVAAAPGQTGVAAEPLVTLAAVRVHVAAWPLLRSLGKDVQVTTIEARGPVIRLARLSGGELSYADVVERLRAPPPPAAEPARRVHAGRIAITGGTVELHDLSRDPEHGGVRLAVEQIDASAPELREGAPLDLTVDAAVLAPARNLHLDLSFAPGGDPPGPLGRLRRASVRLTPLAIDPLLPFLPTKGGFGVAGATLSADAKLAVERGGVTIEGSITAATLRLTHEGGPPTAPVDATVRADLTVDPGLPAIEARSLSISAGGMTIEGRADVRGPLETPEVRALDLRARDVTFERLLALAPASLLPRGVELRGPVEIHAAAHGEPRAAAIDVAVDLRGAAVTLPELHKPAGTPLHAELKGKTGEGGVTIDSLGITVGPLALALRGRARSATDVDLAFDSGEVALDAILRLFPAVARAVPAGVALAGAVQASGHVRRSGEDTRAEARVALRRADVKTPALTLTGAADLSAAMHAAPGVTAVTADLDAGGARVEIPGRLDKAAGSPLAIHAVVERAGAVTTVREARLTIAGASASGSGRHDGAAHTLAIHAPACDLDLAALGRAVPALGGVPAALAGARLRAAITLEGDPGDLAAGHLRLEQLDLTAPLGHLKGMVDLAGLSPPRRVTFDLEGDGLDLDALAAAPSGSRAPPVLDGIEAHGKLRLRRLRARALDARDVDAEVSLERGALLLRALRFAAFGGAVTANGSRVELSHGVPAFALRGKVEHLDLAALAAARGEGTPDVQGRLDAEISLDGAGVDWASVAPTLAGSVKIEIGGAHVHTRHTLHATIINPLLGQLAELQKKKHPVREVDMQIVRASAALRVGGGKVSTSSPLTAVTEDGTLTLSGAVGFDKSLALSGSVAIPPAALEKATSGKLVPYGPVIVKLRIDGTTADPKIELLDLGATAKALLGSGIHGLAKRVEHALGK
jgi:hypothetical protein